MNWQEYIPLAVRTESRINPNTGVLFTPVERMLHAALGLCTEAGELLDAHKKFIFYGKPLDRVNIKEEIGDLCWYCAIVCDVIGATDDLPDGPQGFGPPLTAAIQLNQLCANLLPIYNNPKAWSELFPLIFRMVNAHCWGYGFTLDEVLEANIAKLRAKCPGKFKESAI